ncbi:tetratricopeptide repeat protein [Kitasatospora sp. NBC_00039]|uniref:tetratricopeptide repeat protein n=1 Tax=Kitasatospora sp. NBC_00039 TaxID=2903565 RepID=UPI003866FD0C
MASRNRLAWTVGQLGRVDEAETDLRRILGIRRGLFGDEHTSSSAAWAEGAGLCDIPRVPGTSAEYLTLRPGVLFFVGGSTSH